MLYKKIDFPSRVVRPVSGQPSDHQLNNRIFVIVSSYHFQVSKRGKLIRTTRSNEEAGEALAVTFIGPKIEIKDQE
jgi:hypothetical protein